MAAKRGGVTITPAVAQEDKKELPRVEAIGLAPSGRGWVVVSIVTQGDRVVDREVLSVDPEPKSYAAQRALKEIIKAFVLPQRGVGA